MIYEDRPYIRFRRARLRTMGISVLPALWLFWVDMECTAFPVRLDRRGWLRRGRESESIVSLLEIMARTAYSGWRGRAEFGLRDFFESIGSRRGLQTQAISTLNRNLEDLGIEWFRVESIEKEEVIEIGRSAYSVTLSIAGLGTDTYKIKV